MHTALQSDRVSMSQLRTRARLGLPAAALAALVMLLASGGSASGYVQVGELFPPSSTCAADTFLQTGVGPGNNSYTVPTYGAITSWSFWTGLEPVPALALKVARANGGGSYTIVGESVAGKQLPDQINNFHTDIFVEPGEVLGIYTSGGATPACGTAFEHETGNTYMYVEGNWGPETTTIFQSPLPGPAQFSLFPVAAFVSGPPASAVNVPRCSNGTFAATVAADEGTVPKAIHYTIDGGAELTGKANGAGEATLKGVPPGIHTVEYWGEDKTTQLERTRHTATVFVEKTAPKVTITSDQNKSVYDPGEKGTVTIKASDAYGLSVDPSAAHVPLETAAAGFYSLPEVATDNCGNNGKETFTYTVDPVDRGLRLARSAFAAAPSGATIAKRGTGTEVSYSASNAGTTRFAIYKGTVGVKHGRRCILHHKRKLTGKPCVRFGEEPFGEFSSAATEGENSFHFTGRLDGRALKAGEYRLDATPLFDGIFGRIVSARFRIVR
jgi:hypothetical protein